MFENEFREKYGFSLVVVGPFKDNLTKCAVKCPICGFVKEVQPKGTMRYGFYCDECNRREQERIFLDESRKVHGDRYDYSKTVFRGWHEKLTIICHEHGEFEQQADVHRSGFGCPECSGNKKMTSETFAEKAREVHGDKYDYSRVEYKNNHTKVEIICPIHGSFWTKPNSHLIGRNCPSCSVIGSSGERDIADYVASLLGEENICRNARNILVDETGKIRQYEIDIYIPSMKVGIEVNGEHWHKRKEKEEPGYHKYKSQLIKKNGIALINVAYREWVKNKEQVYNKIRKKIYGY